MNTIQKSCTFSAKSSSATMATQYVTDEIMIYARDNNCSFVAVSHAMIQQGEWIEVTAIAIFQGTIQ